MTGRPQRSPELTRSISTRLSEERIEALSRIAARRGISVSELLRRVISQYIDIETGKDVSPETRIVIGAICALRDELRENFTLLDRQLDEESPGIDFDDFQKKAVQRAPAAADGFVQGWRNWDITVEEDEE